MYCCVFLCAALPELRAAASCICSRWTECKQRGEPRGRAACGTRRVDVRETYGARPLSGSRRASWSVRCCCGRTDTRACLLDCCSPGRSGNTHMSRPFLIKHEKSNMWRRWEFYCVLARARALFIYSAALKLIASLYGGAVAIFDLVWLSKALAGSSNCKSTEATLPVNLAVDSLIWEIGGRGFVPFINC